MGKVKRTYLPSLEGKDHHQVPMALPLALILPFCFLMKGPVNI
jgi:hypothetical protein